MHCVLYHSQQEPFLHISLCYRSSSVGLDWVGYPSYTPSTPLVRINEHIKLTDSITAITTDNVVSTYEHMPETCHNSQTK